MTADIETQTVVQSVPAPTPRRRPLHKRVIHLLRRGHLYLGLFLFPWAILYGVTAFLFNHPTAFSDQPTVTFGKDAVAGTPLENLPTAAEQAEQVVKLLNEKQKPAMPYTLGTGEIKYAREFAFATVKAKGCTVSVLFDVKNGGGTIRSTVDKPKAEPPPKAPFAVGNSSASVGGRGAGPKGPRGGDRPGRDSDAIKLETPLHERVKAAVPAVLLATGTLDREDFADGDVTVTSVPDIAFPVEADGKTWAASYNPMTGAITGKPVEEEEKPELSARRFLLRLHTAHGYPGETNARWYWAVVVDAMAFVMCFWGVTGLIMWWQIKATRRIGAVVLILSAVAATALGLAMHSAMSQ